MTINYYIIKGHLYSAGFSILCKEHCSRDGYYAFQFICVLRFIKKKITKSFITSAFEDSDCYIKGGYRVHSIHEKCEPDTIRYFLSTSSLGFRNCSGSDFVYEIKEIL